MLYVDTDTSVLPGSGKTTIANVVARQTRHRFRTMSAVTAGIAEVADAEFRGETDYAHFGSALAGLGELDSEGAYGIAIGAPDAANGAVYVFTGPFEGSLEQSMAVGVLSGSAVGDGFGATLMGGVDYDEDGQSDLFVGAPGVDASKGRVYVLLGGAL